MKKKQKDVLPKEWNICEIGISNMSLTKCDYCNIIFKSFEQFYSKGYFPEIVNVHKSCYENYVKGIKNE